MARCAGQHAHSQRFFHSSTESLPLHRLQMSECDLSRTNALPVAVQERTAGIRSELKLYVGQHIKHYRRNGGTVTAPLKTRKSCTENVPLSQTLGPYRSRCLSISVSFLPITTGLAFSSSPRGDTTKIKSTILQLLTAAPYHRVIRARWQDKISDTSEPSFCWRKQRR